MSFCPGCQMVHFHTKNPHMGIFRRVLERKMLVYLMTLLNISRPIWYIL
jgi:hypothetical protein